MKKTFGKTLLAAFAVALIALSVTGCNEKKDTKLKKIIIGESTQTYPILAVGLEKGFFKEELGNIEVEVINGFNAGPALIEAMTSKKIDIGMLGDQPVVASLANNKTDLKIIANVGSGAKGTLVFLPKGSDIKTGYDLKGKRVAVVFGTSHHKFLLKYLESFGLSDKEVTLVNLGDADTIAAAISGGDVDAALYLSTSIDTFNALGCTILTTAEGYTKNSTVLAGRNEFLSQNPEVVEAFLRAFNKSVEYVNANKEESIQIKAKALDGGTAKSIRMETVHLDTSDYAVTFDKSDFDDYVYTAQFGYNNGSFKSLLTLSDIVDTKYYDKAFKK